MRNRGLFAVLGLGLGLMAIAHAETQAQQPSVPTDSLAAQLQVGDVLFIRVPAGPFIKIASATNSWTNHVGIVTQVSAGAAEVSESAVPWSRATTLAKFVKRSENGRIEVRRLSRPLTATEQARIVAAARSRYHIHYDTGFDLHSRGEFCSRYVREVLQEGTGVQVGTVERFGDLLAQNKDESLTFWRLWYFGRIPWDRETVTPANLLRSAELQTVFDGYATTARKPS